LPSQRASAARSRCSTASRCPAADPRRPPWTLPGATSPMRSSRICCRKPIGQMWCWQNHSPTGS
jgi:hypothetical protein